MTTKRKAFAFDPRLAIGLLLVVASVVAVVGVVSSADRTVQVYAARDPLAPGDKIRADDLQERSVRLENAGQLYLLPGDIPAAGLVVTRTVSPGELVPASAIGSVDGLRLTSIVLTMSSALAASVQPGSVVDVWAAREVENGQFGPPTVIVAGASVVRLLESDSIVAAHETTGIEVLVPKAKIARVLEALANDDAISVVPAGLPGR
ncbi:MAG: SAF domain-containing protein [Rhodoglobus sp.]